MTDSLTLFNDDTNDDCHACAVAAEQIEALKARIKLLEAKTGLRLSKEEQE